MYYNFEVADIDEAYNHFTKHGVETTKIDDFGLMKGFDFFDLMVTLLVLSVKKNKKRSARLLAWHFLIVITF
ncbi:hypothetical protein [Aquisalibacillus elongatus]|uniref:hypothetical protein n=1 Tax=Aquisalibacillus elongatus TaxID=485577 RepID=UPI001472E640|nr:hypothetical protein [Aquisalibacillus elongatus]